MGIELPDLDFEKISCWIEKVAQSYGCKVMRLMYTFMDDAGILEANQSHLGHDYYTDVITFDYCRDEKLLGEILISLDTVKSNAEMMGEEYKRELMRVIIHGVLHLCGIKDKTPGWRNLMEYAENKALDSLI